MTNSEYLSQMKILFVEDDDDTRENLRQYLKKKVGKVVTAVDGEDGLRKFEDEQPDIVIADILMPKLNGLEMLRRIRESGGKSPFIITSTAEKTDTILEAVNVGIVKYVVKPIILSDLLGTLEKIADELQISDEKILFPDLEEKKELEKRIKKSFTLYLKKSIGKGPRDLNVFINNDEITITAYDTLTQLEKVLLEDKRNTSIIEHIHRNYYAIVKDELVQLLVGIVKYPVGLNETEFSLMRSSDRLVFRVTNA